MSTRRTGSSGHSILTAQSTDGSSNNVGSGETVTPPEGEAWTKLSKSQKLEWLNKLTLPEDPTTTLAQCYHRAQMLSNIFYVLFRGIHMMRSYIDPKDTVQKRLLDDFIHALNESIGHFHWELYLDNQYLLAHGKYPETGLKMAFLNLPGATNDLVLPALTEDGQSDIALVNRSKLADIEINRDALGNLLGTGNWVEASLGVIVTLLQSKYPPLTKVRPELGMSYAQLLESALIAGKKFLSLYQAHL